MRKACGAKIVPLPSIQVNPESGGRHRESPTKPSMTVAAWQMERSDLGHSDQPGQTVARGNVAPCRILSRWSRFQKESGVCSLSCGGGYPQARWCRWIPRRCGSTEAASLSRATAGRDSPSLTRLRRLVAAATNTGRRSHCGNAAPDSGGGAYRFRRLSCGSSNGRKSRRVGSVGCSDGTATHRMSGKVRVQRDSVIASAAIPSLRAPRSNIPKRARAVPHVSRGRSLHCASRKHPVMAGLDPAHTLEPIGRAWH